MSVIAASRWVRCICMRANEGCYDLLMAAAQTFRMPEEAANLVTLRLTDLPRRRRDWFYHFCQANRDWQFEQTAEGDILVMSPVGGESGDRETRLIVQLDTWATRNGLGKA